MLTVIDGGCAIGKTALAARRQPLWGRSVRQRGGFFLPLTGADKA
ncbi:MAG: hypothetical protein Q4G07_05180 [Oscillospiraceae bacterium]|nr:hypothetical protein [Oscillospiraceae bacterium]